MVDLAQRYIIKNDMLAGTSTVLCAVSGGADSMALLEILSELKSYFNFELYAAHFNHNLRREESDRDEAFVRSWCEKKGIIVFIGSGDVNAAAKQSGDGIEETARRLRYEFFESTLKTLAGGSPSTGKIATAHNADDNLETLIMRIARGTSLSGLGGIPPVRGDIIRPILFATRAEIESFLAEKDIKYVTDSTNFDTKYTRNLVRHEVIPVLKKLNPRAPEAALTTSELLRADDSCLLNIANSVSLTINDGSVGVPVSLLGSPAIASRVIMKMLEIASAPLKQISSKHIDAVIQLCGSESGSANCDLPGNIVAERVYDSLVIKQKASPLPMPAETELKADGTVSFGNCKISLITSDITDNILNSVNTFVVNYDIISCALLVRTRKVGDSLKLKSRPHKTLKKLLIEMRVPRSLRDELPVICHGDDVVAVFGIGVDERYLPTDCNNKAIITIEREEG